MNEANRLKLGGFLLISIVLLILGFVSVGVGKLFEPRFQAMTVLNTSVEGLAVGSPVKYLGLPVGKITGMAMRRTDGYIAVYFEILPSMLEREGASSGSDAGDMDFASVMHQKNLSCFVNAAGIMGGAYLELSSSESLPSALPYLNVRPPDGVTYIPSRPSHIGNAIQNISRMLEGLSQINFIQFADKLDETIDSLGEILNRKEFQNTLTNIDQICASLQISSKRLEVALSSENVDKINHSIANLDAGLASLRKLSDDPEAMEAVKNLNAFLKDAVEALEEARTAGTKVGEDAAALRRRFEMTLTRLDNSLQTLQEFTRNVSADPNQFVRGRQEPPLPESAK